ncbi:protein TRIGALACTOSYLDIACYLGLYCEROL 3, chloroplastic isoform X1 [Aegilops tauschii subsp. strangulata]|nr:protein TRIGALACTOSYLDIACYLGLYCEROL 3, chloroplastic [Aegilops tauschii subsp. strangulata]XP_044398902.1 protein TRIGALACTOSYLDIACYLGLYCEROL 3, chloroplastic-like [Triticum aestivum]
MASPPSAAPAAALRCAGVHVGCGLLPRPADAPCLRAALPFRLGVLSSRTCRAGAGVVVSATRSPGLGNAGNLREGSNLSKNWDLSRQIGDEHGVLIECRDVHKSFGDKHVLQGVSFKIRHGEAVGIIGPSGTGKSTILKVMAGLLAPDKGEVFICGKKRQGLVSDEDISGLRIGLVFQSAALFDSLNVRENVGFLLYENSKLSEERIGELVTETLAAVGLKGVEERMPSELSGGMKKRVALARSIINDDTKETIEPEALLYDEPTAGLDPIASTVVEDLIRSMHVTGKDAMGKPGKIASYAVVTHQHSTIRRAVDRLLFLHEGKIVWEGMTEEFTTSTNPIVQQFASGSLDGPIRYF